MWRCCDEWQAGSVIGDVELLGLRRVVASRPP
jgi:hypothetical protein